MQFKKIVYIDADCLVLENIDHLFFLNTNFAAAPDIFPPDKFNAGVMVIIPNNELFNKMIESIGILPSHDNGDTGFLNSFFYNWYRLNSESRLSFNYNAQRTMYHYTFNNKGYWDSLKPIKIIHYCSSPKPWEVAMSNNNKGIGDLELLWWKKYIGIE